MENIQTQNGKKMAKILKTVGPAGATIKKSGEWDLSVYITDQDEKEIQVEMAASKDLYGDLFLDPFMRICLKKNQKGQITQAIPTFYQSDNLFLGRMEIREKGEIFINGELTETDPRALDEKLESWLTSIDLIGYLTKPDEINFHETGETDCFIGSSGIS